MSAFLCDPLHLATLAREMTRRMMATGETKHMSRAAVRDMDADVVVANMARANWESVTYCYAHNLAGITQPYASLEDYVGQAVAAVGRVPLRQLPLPRLAGALWCYEYQSCEHPGWEQSAAYKHCQALRNQLLRILATNAGAQIGIETGWHLDRKEVA
jgi:hypothetical protein